MSSIDDRIVQMQFDNNQFQKGVADTNQSLTDLKDNLKLDGATDGLNNIQQTASQLSLTSISDGVSHISAAFSTLGVIGINVLSRISQDALSAGKNLLDSVLGPLIDGGQARAIAIENAKFQFRGLDLDIEATMAAAKTAVLGTAFGLQDAATAAAQFGASSITVGHGLEAALRGVAGVAAQTNSSYADIANIYEKIAGQTTLKSEDLNSLAARGVNAAAVLAQALGKTEPEIRDMVTHSKISFQEFSDAMEEKFGKNATKASETFQGALANMKAALSRAGQTFFTPFDEAQRQIFVALAPQIDALSLALQPIVQAFAQISQLSSESFVKIIKGLDFTLIGDAARAFSGDIRNIYNFIKQIGDIIGSAFGEIFPAPTLKQIQGIASALFMFTFNLGLGSKAADDLKSTFKGVFAIFDIIFTIVGKLAGVFFDLVGFTGQGSEGILAFTGNIGDFLVKIDKALKSSEGFAAFFETLKQVLSIPIAIIKVVIGLFGALFNFLGGKIDIGGFDDFSKSVNDRFSGLVAVAKFFQAVWEGVMKVVGPIIEFFRPLIQKLGDAIGEFVHNITDALSSLNFDQVLNLINTGLFGGFLAILASFGGDLEGLSRGIGIGIVSKFNLVFGQLQVNLKALEINTNAKTLLAIAAALALLAASAIGLSLVNPVKLAAALGAIAVLFKELLGAFAVFSKAAGDKGLIKLPLIAATMILLALAIDQLTLAVVALGLIPTKSLVQGLFAITLLIGEMVGVSKLLTAAGPGIVVAAGSLVILAAALQGMAIAVAILAFIPLDRLITGMSAFTVILIELVAATKLISSRGPGFILAAAGLLILAVAMDAIAGAVAIFAALSLDKLAQGIGAFTIVLGELIGTVKLLASRGPGVIIATVALLGLAVAINIIAGAVAILSTIPLDRMAIALGALTVILVEVVAAMKLLSGSIFAAAALVIAAVAINILAASLLIFSKLSWDDIGRAMVALGGSLAILVVALTLMGDPLVLLGSLALIIAAGALAIIAPALLLLGTMPWDSIGRGLTLLAGALVILALGGIALAPAIPGLLGLGFAILLLGAGVALAGIGVAALAVGIAALVAVGGAGIAVFSAGIIAFGKLIPDLGTHIGEGIVAMATAIGEGAPKLLTAFTEVILAMLTAIDNLVPDIVNTAVLIIETLVDALTVLIPDLVNAGLTILVGILNGIGSHTEAIVTAALLIIQNFIQGIANGLPGILQAGANLIISFINGLADTIRNNRKAVADAMLNLADAITGGLSTGLLNGAKTIINSVKKLISNIPEAIRNILGIHSPSRVTTELGEFTAQGMADGIGNLTKTVHDAGADLGTSAMTGLQSTLSGISDAVSANVDINPTIRPVLDLSAIKKDSSQIAGMIGTGPTLSLDSVKSNATVVANGYDTNLRVATDADGQPTGEPTTGDTFIQNNYSPKALSAAEIYRQTNSQLVQAQKKGGETT